MIFFGGEMALEGFGGVISLMVPPSCYGGMFLTKSYGLVISIMRSILICHARTNIYAVSWTFFLLVYFITCSFFSFKAGLQHILRHALPLPLW